MKLTMTKQAIVSGIVSAIVALIAVYYLGGSNFAGVTHLSGLSIGSGGLTVTGTTTIAKSPDGFVAWDDVSTVATGTAKAVYTNTGSPMMCDADSGAVYFKSNGFSPSLVVSMGTSTSATGYATNLLASTTVATTTTAVVPLTYAVPFVLGNNQSLVVALSDITNANASSTYYSNWAIEMGIQCRTLGR